MRTVSEDIPDVLDGERIDRVVSMVADIARGAASDLVDDGAVSVDGIVVTKRSTRVSVGQSVSVDLPDVPDVPLVVADPTVEFDVVYEDEHLAVVDKPAGLVVHPGAGNDSGTLAHGLLARYPEMQGVGPPERPGIVHRLDRDTSGLLVVARTTETLEALRDALAARTVTRAYRTLVWGHVEEPQGLVDAPIGRSPRDPTRMAVVVGGRESRTRYEVVRHYHDPVEATELVCRLETGRTHQIRVHLQALGHPVVGDSRYGGARESFPHDRQFLHAEHLAFEHPVSGDVVSVSSQLPEDLARVAALLS